MTAFDEPETPLTLFQSRLLLLGLVSFFFLVDRFVKDRIIQHMETGETLPVIPNVFHITYVHNPGAAFSLLQQHPQLLLVLASVLFLGFLLYSLRKPVGNPWETVALSLILGGALGNITDRLFFGKVIDYLDVVVIHYPIFNLADTFIFCGIAWLLLRYVGLASTPPVGS